mmetsp:Transcript_6625/g.24386  ORF Transcript_6625/g.24386 Transcript_6625/m.24386 type:complete len:250 (+) Transcript_6625:1863-2612(+)
MRQLLRLLLALIARAPQTLGVERDDAPERRVEQREEIALVLQREHRVAVLRRAADDGRGHERHRRRRVRVMMMMTAARGGVRARAARWAGGVAVRVRLRAAAAAIAAAADVVRPRPRRLPAVAVRADADQPPPLPQRVRRRQALRVPDDARGALRAVEAATLVVALFIRRRVLRVSVVAAVAVHRRLLRAHLRDDALEHLLHLLVRQVLRAPLRDLVLEHELPEPDHGGEGGARAMARARDDGDGRNMP